MPRGHPDAGRARRSGLTEWERAADDIDRAEWALLEALDAGDAGRVREAEERLAQSQKRAGRLRPGSHPSLGTRKPCRARSSG